MSTAKKKFNIVDFLIIFVITATTIIRIYVVKRFENEFSPAEASITLSLDSVDENTASKIKVGDKIYIFDKFGNTPFGVVSDVSSSKSIVNATMNKNESYFKLNVDVNVSVLGSTNSNGEFLLGKDVIKQGMWFNANNGVIEFDCEVISVKISN